MLEKFNPVDGVFLTLVGLGLSTRVNGVLLITKELQSTPSFALRTPSEIERGQARFPPKWSRVAESLSIPV